MSNFIPVNNFENVRQIETTDAVLGGDVMQSPVNMAMQSLVNRIEYLKANLTTLPNVPVGSESVIGLQRYAQSSEVQTIEENLSNSAVLNPLRFNQLISRFAAGTVPDADEETSGLVELSTQIESTAGNSNSVVPTVDNVKRMIETFGDASLTVGNWTYSLVTVTNDGDVITNNNYSIYIKIGSTVFVYLGFYVLINTSGANSVEYTIHNATPTISSGNVFGFGRTEGQQSEISIIPTAIFKLAAKTHNNSPAIDLRMSNIVRYVNTRVALCKCFLIYTSN